MDFKQLMIDLELIVGEREMKSRETMVRALERLDSSAQSDSTPSQLKHYLVQRSYVKALDLIKGSYAPHQV